MIKKYAGILYTFLGVIALATTLTLIYLMAHHALFDKDIWLHLKTGEIIVRNTAIPNVDIFSYTINGKPWINHEWLFQVIYYLIYVKWGVGGLITAQTYAVILPFIILLLIGYKKLKSYFLVAVLILISAFASEVRFNIRPDILSLTFFTIYLYFLNFGTNKKTIFVLVLLQVFWVNIHGYFFLGPMLILLLIASEFLRRNLSILPAGWKKEAILNDTVYQRMIWLFILTVAACFINPQGISGAVYPVRILQDMIAGSSGIFFRNITELLPTFSTLKLSEDFYYVILFICFELIVFNFRRLKVFDVILFIFIFLFSLSVRNVAFFSIAAFFLIISYLPQSLKKISEISNIKTAKNEGIIYFCKVCTCIAFIIWSGSKIDRYSQNRYFDYTQNKVKSYLLDMDTRRYPIGAVDFILKHNIAPNLFNDFNSGAYLIGRAYPKVKVFIDGRTELYGAKFYQAYKDAINGKRAVFNNICAKYNINAALISMDYASPLRLLKVLYDDPKWKLVFFDETGVVFLKDLPENQEVISKFGIDLKKYRVTPPDLIKLGLHSGYPFPYIKKMAFFKAIGENDIAIEEANQAIKIKPDCAEAYRILGQVYLNKNMYLKAFENLRLAVIYSPENIQSLIDLSRSLEKLNAKNEAIALLESATRINPKAISAYYELACAYESLGEKQKAIKAIKKAKELAEANENLDLSASIKIGLKFHELTLEKKKE